MRNLKRTLSLLLAAVMVIGLMVVGASAVSYNDFPDRDEIVNKDAVSMLTTLGIIEGTDQGTFDPSGNVDRAQMAKMISVIMNQGADNSALYVSTVTNLTDVDNHWASGHIKYCYTNGIIAGRGDGTFDPDANVTAVEAAKMLLVAAGYDPAIEGLEGTDWALNTNALASRLGIFRNFTKDVTQPLNRDDAALLIYNALDVEMIQQYSNGYAIAYSDHRTILSAMYGVYKMEGVVVANEWAALDGEGSETALREGRTTLDNIVLYGSTTANTTTGEDQRLTAPETFQVSTTEDMLGKTVTFYIEKTTILSNSKIIGYAINDDDNVVLTSVENETSATNFLKGTGISVNSSTEYYVNYGYCENAAEALALINDYLPGSDTDNFNLNGVEVEVIDNDDDGVAEYVLFLRETLSEVSRYNDRNESITFYAPDYDRDGNLLSTASTVTRDFEDVVFNDEVTTNDLILYVEYGGRTYISLPEIVTGTMTRVDRDRDSELYITVDGSETYYQSYILDAASPVDVDLTRFDIDDARNEPGFTTEYDFILDSNGFIVAIRPAEEVVTNYALVLNSAWTQNALAVEGQVKILMADGTEGTYDINWNSSRKAFDGVNVGTDLTADDNTNSDLDDKLETYLGTRDVVDGTGTGAAKGSIITYTISDDDVLTIRSVLQGNTLANTTSLEIASNVNTDSTAGVGDNGDIVYMGKEDSTLQYTSTYTNGRGSITVEGTGDRDGVTKTYAVDRNTVAFYYYVENGSVKYGVATGWNAMSTISDPVGTQVYPVLNKTTYATYEASDLAGVILFEAEPTNVTADYMLVLDANAATKDTWELTVVFEDGTVAAIDVDDDDLGDFDPTVESDFMLAYSYSQNSDGTYVVGDVCANYGVADLLRVGTVDFRDADGTTDPVGLSRYIALSGNADVWDVTEVENANDTVDLGSFVLNRDVYAVVIIEDNAIRTAWIWDKEDDVVPVDPTLDYEDLYVTERTEGNIDVYSDTVLSARQVASAVRTFLNDADIASVEYTPANHKAVVTYNDGTSVEYDVTVTVTTEAAVTAQAAKDIIESANYTLYYNGAPTFYTTASEAYANKASGNYWAGDGAFVNGLSYLINNDLDENACSVRYNTFVSESATKVGSTGTSGVDGYTEYFTYDISILDSDGNDTGVDATVSYSLVFCDVNA